MITKINKIKKFGAFADFRWGDHVPPFEKYNLIYGTNGSGKTTLTNILNLLKCQNKESLFANLATDIDSLFEIVINDKAYTFTKEKYPFDCNDIYIFNSDFVNEHVYEGNKSNLKKFDEKIKLSDPTITMIERQLGIINNRITRITEYKTKLEKDFENTWDRYSKEFKENILERKKLTKNDCSIDSELPSVELKEEQSLLKTKYAEYSKSLEQETIKNNLNKINVTEIKGIKFDIDHYASLLNSNIKEIAKSTVKGKILEINKYLKNHSESNKTKINFEEWLKTGRELLKINFDNKYNFCPLCNTNIENTINELMDDYSFYFNNEYEKLQEEIKVDMASLKNISNILINNLKEIDTIKNIFEKNGYKINFPTIKIKQIESVIVQLLALGEKKLNSLYMVVNIDESRDAEFDRYNENLEECKNIIKTSLKEIVISFREPNDIIEEIKNHIRNMVLLEFNQEKQKSKSYKRAKQILAKLEILNKDNNENLSAAKAKLKYEANFVNEFLKKLGVFTFYINSLDGNDNNIEIHFTKTKTTKKYSKYCISEGEKTALAFAYFLSKIEYESIRGKRNQRNTMVVIDDPISSLDENRIYKTACVVGEYFKDFEQIIVFSHNIIFLKNLNTVLGEPSSRMPRKDFYLYRAQDDIVLTEIPEIFNNYTTTYYLKLSDIYEYVNGNIKYEEAQKYLCNYIRIVLETYLSFKLSYLGKIGKTPGLDKLVNELRCHPFYKNYKDKHSCAVNKMNVQSKLEHIRDITNSFEHGSIQKLDSYDYISKPELDLIAQDTIDTILFLDDIHYDGFLRMNNGTQLLLNHSS